MRTEKSGAARDQGLSANATLNGIYAANPEGGAPQPYQLSQAVPGGLGIAEAQALASQIADDVLLPTGSKAFNDLRQQIVSGVGAIEVNGARTVRGAAFANTARFYDLSTQKEWQLTPTTNVVAGASFRSHRLRSAGTLLADGDKSPIAPGTNEVQLRDRIINYEGGAYGQIRQDLLNNRLRLAFAGRVDNFKNFGTRFSPRASGVLSLGENREHNVRLSYAQAYRQPAQLDQYIYLDFGSLLVMGNIDKGFEGLNAVSTLPNGQPNPNFLKPQTIKNLSPEQANTWEIGYKAQITKGFYLDASYYRSRYQDFIGTLRFYGREDGIAIQGTPFPASGDFAKLESEPVDDAFRTAFAGKTCQQNTRPFQQIFCYVNNRRRRSRIFGVDRILILCNTFVVVRIFADSRVVLRVFRPKPIFPKLPVH